MKLYSGNGKFTPQSPPKGHRPRKKRVCQVRIIILSTIAAVLFIAVAGMGGYVLHTTKASNEFEALAAIVHNTPSTPAKPAASTPPVSNAASPDTPSQEAEPTVSPEKTILPQYTQLYEQNPELFGWLQIKDTKIDYPVMYTPDDPEKYLHTNFKGEYSFGGIPFLDANCTSDSDNLIIYAHNMLDGSMFRTLLKYQEKTYWQNHPTIIFNTIYEEQEYEVLAAFYDRVYYKSETCFKFYQFINAADEADFDNAIMNYREKALYDTGVTASFGDKLITLVTCAYHVDNGRFVVVARRK